MRSGNVTFVDTADGVEPRRAYCPRCEELDGIFNKLVPRVIDGIADDKFKVCSFCGEIVPIFDVKFFTEYEPKGFITDNPFDSGSKVVIQSQRRKSRHLHKNKPLPNDDVVIPKFAGKEDIELEKMVREEGAVINKITDSWTDDNED